MLCDSGHDAHVIFGDSQDQQTRPYVDRLTGGALFDAALIDGDHRYAAVKRDWLNWRDAARIVAFHDICGDGISSRGGRLLVEVPQLWREIKDEFRHREIAGKGSKMGIGVLWQ